MNYYNYFTEIEEHFVRKRGRHMLVSPMDWSLIETWRESGIPLHVVLRGIDVAMDAFHARKHRRQDKVNSLFYCHDSVMAEYAMHLESHLGEEQPHPSEAAAEGFSLPGQEATAGPDKVSVTRFLCERISEIRALEAKHILEGTSGEDLRRVITRLEEIASSVESENRLELEPLERDLGILDDLLVATLRAATAPELVEEWEKEAKAELKIYRKRLPKETYGRILENFLRTRHHRHFGLGELSLFHI